MSAMKDLVEYIAKALADKPHQVQVSEIEGEAALVLELRVAPEDMGRIIGERRANRQCDSHPRSCARRQAREAGHPGNRLSADVSTHPRGEPETTRGSGAAASAI
jgi:hypothetical protein